MDAFPGLQAFLINLDRSPERLAHMRERLAPTGLAWQRVPAVDGRTLDLASRRDIDMARYQRWHGKALNPAEAGCYLSHLQAMRRLLAGPWTHALVLEDDAAFAADFGRMMARLLELRDHWDVVKLSSFHSGTPVAVAPLAGPYRLAVPLTRHSNSNSIVLNRRAAEVLLEQLVPMRLPYDHALERCWLHGLRLRVVTPPPCAADSGLASTITPGQAQHRKFAWHRRLPAHAFRVRNELARVAYGLAHVMQARLRRGARR